MPRGKQSGKLFLTTMQGANTRIVSLLTGSGFSATPSQLTSIGVLL